MYYSGVGARKTPKSILGRMVAYGEALATKGMILRSGAADGADSAFEEGCDNVNGEKEIYLPWKNAHKHPSHLYHIPPHVYDYAADIYGESWQYLKPYIQKLMARDIQQVLGKNLDVPASFVLCWTPDGCLDRKNRTRKTGGTGQAIACASENNIPVFNLQRDREEDKFIEFLGELTYGI